MKMGLTTSKACKQVPQNDFQEGSIPSTPIVAPKVVKKEDLDPRSPSTHISRTPLQLLSAATLKLDELKQTTTADITPAKLNAVLLGMDPRSPTAEFKRTPIIVNVSEPEVSDKIQNKNLDRVKRSVIVTTPKSISKKQNVPPKLIDSSPLRVKSNANSRKSFVGLLETNLDFTETDLDEVIREKSRIKETVHSLSDSVTPRHKQFNTIMKGENIDPRSPTTDFLRTPIQIIKKMTDLDINCEATAESESKNIKKECKQNVVAVELEDHRIVEKCVQEICESIHLVSEQEKEDKPKFVQKDNPEVNDSTEVPVEVNDKEGIEEWQDEDIVTTEMPIEIKSAPITPPSADNMLKSVVLPITKETKSAPVTPPVNNITANVMEFDRKLTNLIYRDDDIVICPRTVKLKDYDSRSPLRNLNSNEPEKRKSTEKLKSKQVLKKSSEFAVSKIPVFKEKGKNIEVQCENTPPRNLEKRKVKVRRSHWDNADTTLII